MTAINKQTHNFQAEVKQLLQLMIQSLYSNKEIFLRELISNASDAVDKLRFRALENSGIYAGDTDLKFTLTTDKEKRCLIVSDNGIGMTREEISANLGTIAKSGTKEFLVALEKNKAQDTQLIGQFGVGFYSAFMVAERIVVNTRAAQEAPEQATRWESTGDGQYTLESITKTDRGTEIILYLKTGEEEFLEDSRLRNIITTYSNYISLPIRMKKSSPTSPSDEKTDKATATEELWETVNDTTALWTLPKKEISEDRYKTFYMQLAHDFQHPLAWSHNKVEGTQEYILLLYIPAQAPLDLLNYEKPRDLKLYVQRVFIMDKAEQFLPRYLRFIKGLVDIKWLVDSNNPLLNVSREILQNTKLVSSIRSAIIKRTLDLLAMLAKEEPEKYMQFWKTFGNVLKEGLIEDSSHRDQLAQLLRFSSTRSNSAEQTVSLEDYVGRMQTKQEKIYYITGENYATVSHSSNLEVFREKNIEVLLLYDRVDEWLVNYLTEFDGKSLQSAGKDTDITPVIDKKDEEEQKKDADEFGSLLKQMKEVLGDKVKEVRLSQRLIDSPACIVDEENAISSQMQRILQATGQTLPTYKPILEINPKHRLLQRLKTEQDDTRFSNWAHVLLNQCILAQGGQLEDPATFVKQTNDLIL